MIHLLVLLGMLGGLALGLGLLFLPTIVAKSSNHPNLVPIFLVNLFFGWTFIGWVVSLIWAFTRPAQPVLYAPVYPTVIAPPQSTNAANPIAVLPPSAPYQGPR